MNLTTDLRRARDFWDEYGNIKNIRIASKIFKYNISQLMDLSPGGNVVPYAPFRGQPPPHLLLGYYYVTRVINNYLFDQRTFTNFSFDIIRGGLRQNLEMTWKILLDMSYSLDVYAYRGLVRDGRLDEDLRQIQNAILRERIVAATRGDMRGVGLDQAVAMQNEGRRLGEGQNFLQAFRGIAIEDGDVQTLTLLNSVKIALYNFIKKTRNRNVETELDLPCDAEWMVEFIRHFSQEGSIPVENNEDMLDLVSVLANNKDMTGGAITLRSGRRIGLPFNLRPRKPRPVVRSARRQRRNIIDDLPRPRRRRSRPVIEEVQSDPEEDLSRETFNDIVIREISGLIRELEQHLGNEVGHFFTFTSDLMRVLNRLINREELNDALVRRWLINFFTLEHLASTLYYFERVFQREAPADSIAINFAQIILRARNDAGGEIYTRVWYDNSARPFRALYERLVHDFTVVTDQSSRQAFVAQEERDQLLQDMNFIENSGDVEEVITQITINDEEIHSIELAFRIKITGIVAFSRNVAIVESFKTSLLQARRRWRAEFDEL